MDQHLVAGADLDALQLDIGVQAVQRVLDVDGAGHLDHAAAASQSPIMVLAPAAVSNRAKASRVGRAERLELDPPARSAGPRATGGHSSQRVSRNGGSVPTLYWRPLARQAAQHAADEAAGARREQRPRSGPCGTS